MAASSCVLVATSGSANGAFFMSNRLFDSFNFQFRSRSYQCRPNSTKIQSRGQLLDCPNSCGAKPFPSIVKLAGTLAPANSASVGRKSVKSMRLDETLLAGILPGQLTMEGTRA